MLATYYNPITGQIYGAISSTEDDVILNKPDNNEILEGIFDGSVFYIEDKKAVKIPPKPNEYSVFNFVTKNWEDIRDAILQWEIVRSERDKRLVSTDWTQLNDIPLITKQMWESYRQALRDVTLQPDPFNITWPTPPQ